MHEKKQRRAFAEPERRTPQSDVSTGRRSAPTNVDGYDSSFLGAAVSFDGGYVLPRSTWSNAPYL